MHNFMPKKDLTLPYEADAKEKKYAQFRAKRKNHVHCPRETMPKKKSYKFDQKKSTEHCPKKKKKITNSSQKEKKKKKH